MTADFTDVTDKSIRAHPRNQRFADTNYTNLHEPVGTRLALGKFVQFVSSGIGRGDSISPQYAPHKGVFKSASPRAAGQTLPTIMSSPRTA